MVVLQELRSKLHGYGCRYKDTSFLKKHMWVTIDIEYDMGTGAWAKMKYPCILGLCMVVEIA
jgi:hypothetical protein